MSPNNGILFNGVLIPKQLNNPFDPCFFIRFDILLLHTAPFDDNIVEPFLFYRNFESTFSVSFLNFKEYINMFYKTNFIKNPGTVIFHSLLYFFLWNKDILAIQSAHLEFLLIYLFAIITLFEDILSVCFLQP